MKAQLKNIVSALAPEAFIAMQSIRIRRHSQQLFRQWGVLELNHQLRERLGTAVLTGPFAGMKLADDAFLEQAGPYLLGTYEQELHPWMGKLLQCRFSQVWDIGAKFGYYAIGFARAMPETPVVAFDTDWWARRATARMATANDTTNVKLRKACQPKTITSELPSNSLIICDCEGYERQLFDDSKPSTLDSVTMLIETHDLFVPGVTDFLRTRFRDSHYIEETTNGERRSSVNLDFVEPEKIPLATTEVREQQLWLLLTPKNA